nr:MAG TPA: major capsid protein [Caudoviricetes sp.]
MNKKMTELQEALRVKRREAELAMNAGDTQKAEALVTEAEGLAHDYDTAKRLYELERAEALQEHAETPKKALTPDGWEVLAKFARGGRLTEEEEALIAPTALRKALTTGDSNGSDYLIPEDVEIGIRELRKSYQSALDLVTVIPTESMTGSFTFEKGAPTELSSLTDGNAITVATDPSFVQKTWTIGLYASIIPISNVLAGAERAGLMAYINHWFLRRAILTENKAIFGALKTPKASDIKTISGWKPLRKSLNVDLDPSCLIDAVIVTNQTGYNLLDTEVDNDGRPLLTDSISNPGAKLFNGIPVRVFADGMLPNTTTTSGDAPSQTTTTTAPFIYGSLKSGLYFIRKNGLGMASSEHYLFNKNQLALRMIEGFATVSADAGAYCYGEYTVT